MPISIKRFAGSTLIILMVTFAITFVVDQIVYRLDFLDTSGIYAHPPNFSEWRHNQEYNYLFQTNDAGLRETNLPHSKPSGETRIFVVGDSFTEGIGVTDEARFTNLLTTNMSASSGHTIRFINGGLGGTGPRTYIDVAKKIGLTYNIDAILVCLYANDVSNMSSSRWNWYWHRIGQLFPTIRALTKKIKRARSTRATTETQTYDFVSRIANYASRKGIPTERIDHWRDNLRPDLVQWVQQKRINPAILVYPLLRPNYYTYALDGTGRDGQGKMANYFSALDSLAAIGQAQGIPVAFVYSPCAFQYDPARHQAGELWATLGGVVRAEWLREDTLVQRRLKAWSAERKLPFLDLTPYFRQAVHEGGAQMTFEIDDHWNSSGHYLAATVIGDWLKKIKIINGMQ